MATSATECFPNAKMTTHASNPRCSMDDSTDNNALDTTHHGSPNMTSGSSGLTPTFKGSKKISGSSFTFDDFDFLSDFKPELDFGPQDFPEWGPDEINSFLKLYNDHSSMPSSEPKFESDTRSLNNSGSSGSYKISASRKVSEKTVEGGGLTYGKYESRNDLTALSRTDVWDSSDLNHNKPMSSNFESSSGFHFDSSNGLTAKPCQVSVGLSLSLSTYNTSGYDKAPSRLPGCSPPSSPVPSTRSTVGGARNQLALSVADTQGRNSSPAADARGMSYRAKPTGADSSDFTMRFRNFQSDFLRREYEDESSRKSPAAASSSHHRSVDEILKDFGISNNLPTVTPCSQNEITVHHKTSASHVDLANKSQNNESCSSYQGLKGSFTGVSTSVQPDKDKTFPSVDSMSHTREVPKAADHGLLAKYSPSANFSSDLHLGKSTSFSSNHAVTSSVETDPQSSATTDSKKVYPECGKLLMDGLQSSYSNAHLSLTTASYLDIVKSFGSPTDTLEFMSLLRQRLRKVEAVISATPTSYVSPDIPVFLKHQLQSSNRAYSSLGLADMGHSKNLPRSAFSSSTTHESGVSCKSNTSFKAATRNGSVSLASKSHPLAETPNLKSLKPKFYSAAEPRCQSSCWRDVDPPFPSQTPTCAARIHDRDGRLQNSNSNQKKNSTCKGKETLPRTSKDYPSRNNCSAFYSGGVSSGMSFLNPARVDAKCNNRRKAAAQQIESRKPCTAKKHPVMDLNHSRSFIGGIIASDFLTDLNRMYQATFLGAQRTTRSDQNHKAAKKYMPYKPREGGPKKSCPATGYLDPFGFDWLQSSVRKSESSWSVARPASVAGRRTSGHDSRLGVEQSARGAQSQTSLAPRRNTQARPTAAPVSRMSFSGPGTAQPKSILKPSSAKNVLRYPPVTNRPSSHQTPYELVRGFSPVVPPKTGRPTCGSAKNIGPGKKRKPVVGNSAKASRRV